MKLLSQEAAKQERERADRAEADLQALRDRLQDMGIEPDRLS